MLLAKKQFYAQNSGKDSLLTLLKTANEDTSKVNLLMGLSFLNDNDSVKFYYAKQALQLAKSLRYNYGIQKALNNIGVHFMNKGNQKEALNFFFEALKTNEETKSKKYMGNILNNIGISYYSMGDYSLALPYYLKSLKLNEELKDKAGMAAVYRSIGTLYMEQSNYINAREQYKQASKLSFELNDSEGKLNDYANMANIYYFLKKYSEALDYSFKAFEIQKKENLNEEYLVGIFMNIANVYYEQKNYKRALKNYLNSLKLCLKFENKFAATMNYNNIAVLYITTNDYINALNYLNTGLALAKEIEAKNAIKEFYLNLSQAYNKKEDYKQAYKYYELFFALNDSLFNKEKSKQIAEMQTKYESEKKELKIESLSQQNDIQSLQLKQNKYFFIGMSVIIGLILTIGFLILGQNRLRAAQVKTGLEQKLLRSQMNPHFIFNAMTSIQNYIYNEKPQEAANYLSSVFKLMRSILESSRKEYVELEKEIATLQHYLILQQLCFHQKFDFIIESDNKMDLENILIPPMMAQPFIENAIEHGILNKPNGKGTIAVRITLHNDTFSLEIEDNGIGREKAREISRKNSNAHLSVATSITEERLTLLNKKSKKKISFLITDLKNEKKEGIGTKVAFVFPLNTIV